MIKIILILLITFLSNCNSTNLYLKNRAKDFGDIFILTVEKRLYGLNLEFILFGAGVQNSEKAEGFGIRHGHFGRYKAGGNKVLILHGKEKGKTAWVIGNNIFIIYSYQHTPVGEIEKRDLKKQVSFYGVLTKRKYKKEISYKNESYEGGYPFFEYSFGLYYGIRLGINVSELLDFLFGIANLDITEDDLIEEDLEEIFLRVLKG